MLTGDATFGPKNAVKANVTAKSTQYGPLEAAVSGTFDAPRAVVKAASPGLGVGIKDVVAEIAGMGSDYTIKGTGDSDYGPFSADTLVPPRQGAH
ncbi:MAG: hypothetical protein WDN06_04655 [Asticcacaulis sp.]